MPKPSLSPRDSNPDNYKGRRLRWGAAVWIPVACTVCCAIGVSDHDQLRLIVNTLGPPDVNFFSLAPASHIKDFLSG